jgi:hypothetical protein
VARRPSVRLPVRRGELSYPTRCGGLDLAIRALSKHKGHQRNAVTIVLCVFLMHCDSHPTNGPQPKHYTSALRPSLTPCIRPVTVSYSTHLELHCIAHATTVTWATSIVSSATYNMPYTTFPTVYTPP